MFVTLKVEMFYLLFFSLLLTSEASTCKSDCRFLFNNLTGNQTYVYSYKELWRQGSTRSGSSLPLRLVITVNGTVPTSCDKGDYLKFINKHPDPLWDHFSAEVMALEIRGDYWILLGRLQNIPIGQMRLNRGDSSMMLMQISSYTRKAYDIHLNNHHFRYNYFDRWDFTFSNRFDTVTVINSRLSCSSYQYIMACNNAKPRICSATQPTLPPIINQDYVLSCFGAGSPILLMDWDIRRPALPSTQLERIRINTIVTQPDHIISSVTIINFSVYDIGEYACVIRNKHYKSQDFKVIYLSYNETITSTPPASLFYSPGDRYLRWSITGWPLRDFNLTCTNDYQVLYIGTMTPYREEDRRKTFLIPTSFSKVRCALPDTAGQKELPTKPSFITALEFTRIGNDCTPGHYGMLIEGKILKCLICPRGTTSLPQSASITSCFKVSSVCKSGQYAKMRCRTCSDDVFPRCEICPSGMNSAEGAVKIEECFYSFERKGWDKFRNPWIYAGAAAGAFAGIGLMVVLLVIYYYMRRSTRHKIKEGSLNRCKPIIPTFEAVDPTAIEIAKEKETTEDLYNTFYICTDDVVAADNVQNVGADNYNEDKQRQSYRRGKIKEEEALNKLTLECTIETTEVSIEKYPIDDTLASIETSENLYKTLSAGAVEINGAVNVTNNDHEKKQRQGYRRRGKVKEEGEEAKTTPIETTEDNDTSENLCNTFSTCANDVAAGNVTPDKVDDSDNGPEKKQRQGYRRRGKVKEEESEINIIETTVKNDIAKNLCNTFSNLENDVAADNVSVTSDNVDDADNGPEKKQRQSYRRRGTVKEEEAKKNPNIGHRKSVV